MISVACNSICSIYVHGRDLEVYGLILYDLGLVLVCDQHQSHFNSNTEDRLTTYIIVNFRNTSEKSYYYALQVASVSLLSFSFA